MCCRYFRLINPSYDGAKTVRKGRFLVIAVIVAVSNDFIFLDARTFRMSCRPVVGDLRQHGSSLDSAEQLPLTIRESAVRTIDSFLDRFWKDVRGSYDHMFVGTAGGVLSEMIL